MPLMIVVLHFKGNKFGFVTMNMPFALDYLIIYNTNSFLFAGLHCNTSMEIRHIVHDIQISLTSEDKVPKLSKTYTVVPVIYDHRVRRPPFICDRNFKDQYSLLH